MLISTLSEKKNRSWKTVLITGHYFTPFESLFYFAPKKFQEQNFKILRLFLDPTQLFNMPQVSLRLIKFSGSWNLKCKKIVFTGYTINSAKFGIHGNYYCKQLCYSTTNTLIYNMSMFHVLLLNEKIEWVQVIWGE